MRFLPRFRISTVLILTAILAWGMATRPYVGLDYWSNAQIHREPVVGHIPEVDDEYWTLEASSRTATNPWELQLYIGPNPQLAWPAFALLTFLAWKAAWAIRGRIKEPQDSPG